MERLAEKVNVSKQIKKDLNTMAQNEGYGKIVVSAVVGAALGISVTFMTGVSTNSTEIVRLSTQVENLADIIQSTMIDRYKGADATRDFSLVAEQIRNLRNTTQQEKDKLDGYISLHRKEHEQ